MVIVPVTTVAVPAALAAKAVPHSTPVQVAAVSSGVAGQVAGQGSTPSRWWAQGTRLGRCAVLSLLYAVLAALCRPLTAPAAVVVLLPGVALLALAAWRRRPLRRAACSWRSVIPWMVLILLFGGWELTAALWGNDAAHPTFSLLLDPVLETYRGRLVGWLAWLGVGWWLVTR